MAEAARRTVVIFGGAGFIGSHLARAHEDAGDRVVVADLHPKAAHHVQVDVRDRVRLELDQPPARVYNLAAVHRTPGHAPSEYYETNVAGAINVCRWMTEVGAGNCTFTSSISVYGHVSGSVDERVAPAPVSDYGKSKLLAEAVHEEWAKGATERAVQIVRPAVIFGQGEGGNFTRLARALRAGRFVIPGNPQIVKPCGYVADLVRALMFAGDQCGEGLFNFAFPESYNLQEICEAFGVASGFGQPRVVPEQVAGLAIATLKAGPVPKLRALAARASKLTVSTEIVPGTLQERGFRWEFDLVGALRDWQRTSPGYV